MQWLAQGSVNDRSDLAVVGAPIHKASISPSSAHLTPGALRPALARFATWDGDHGVQLENLAVTDLGDVEGDVDDTDAALSHARIETAVAGASRRAAVVAILGGDNSLTWPAMRAIALPGGLSAGWGLLTLDAHHDCRPLEGGTSNGNPVRGLVSDGLPGSRVAQVGINGFANHEDHAAWASQQGVHVHRAGDVREQGISRTVEHALSELRAAGVTEVYVDIDIDVVDRAFAPACPASMPGGLLPFELQAAAFQLGAEPMVRAVDLVEVDAGADVNGITVRLMASVFLSFCAGLASR
ncbi:MAG: agmatinase family protein [Candidatus Dormibacteria bacterium]